MLVHVHATMSVLVPVPGIPRLLPPGTRALDIYAWVGAHAWHARACRDDTLAQRTGSRTESNSYVCMCICLRGVVSQRSVVAAGRGAGSSNGSSDGSVWRSPGIDPGTTASSSSPQRPTQPGPSTPEALGGQPPLAQPPPLSPPPLFEPRPCARSPYGAPLYQPAQIKPAYGAWGYVKGSNGPVALWKWKRMTSKGAQGDAVSRRRWDWNRRESWASFAQV